MTLSTSPKRSKILKENKNKSNLLRQPLGIIEEEDMSSST